MKQRGLMTGDTVFFACTNPDVGVVKRIAKDGSWAVVNWNQNKTGRHKTEHLILLCPVLNAYLVKKGIAKRSPHLKLDWPE
jgi:hypothetical protein